MKLPGVDYRAGVPSSASTAAMPGEAAAQASRVFAEGFHALGQELVKNQLQEAGVSLAEMLNKAELGLKARKYVSAQELRDVFGDAIPEQARGMLTVTDEAGRQVDNPQIPTFLVGDAMFRRAAEKAVEKAGEGITSVGWRGDFQVKAREHVLERSQRVAQEHLKDLEGYLQASQASQVQRLAQAGDYAGARQAAAEATALPLEAREKLLGEVQRAQDVAPLEAAIRGRDPLLADKLISDLNSKGEKDERTGQMVRPFPSLTEHERTVYAERLRAARERASKDFARSVVDASFERHPFDEAARLKFVRDNVKDAETYQHAFAGVKAEGDARRTALLGTVGTQLWTKGKVDRSSDAFRQLDQEGQAKALSAELEYQQRQENLALARQGRTDKEILGWFSTLSPEQKATANVAGEVLKRGGSVNAYQSALTEQNHAQTVVRKKLEVPEALFKDTVLGELVKVPGYTGTTKKAKAVRDDVMVSMEAWRAKYVAEKQAYPTRQEILSELSRAVSDVEVPGTLYGTNKKKLYRAERAGETFKVVGAPAATEQPGAPAGPPQRPTARGIQDVPEAWQERIRRDWQVKNPSAKKVPDHVIVDGFNRAAAAGLVKEGQ